MFKMNPSTLLSVLVWLAAAVYTAADSGGGVTTKPSIHHQGVIGLGISSVKRPTRTFLVHGADAGETLPRLPLSMPTANAIALRGGASEASILVRLMKVHRFIAFGFGVVLLVAPESSLPGIDLHGTLSVREILPNQCWGSFIVAVAYIIHVASTKDSFTESARVEIAKALCGAYAITTGLFVRHLITQELSEEEKKACIVTGIILGAISVAYGLGVVMS